MRLTQKKLKEFLHYDPEKTGEFIWLKGQRKGQGVSWDKPTGKWQARIKIQGKEISLGHHPDKISAALARCRYEICCPDWSCNYLGVNFVKLRKLGYKI